MIPAANIQRPYYGPTSIGSARRVKDRRSVGKHTGAKPACDQHLSVWEQRGRMAAYREWQRSGDGPRAACWIEQLRAIERGAAGPDPPGHQHFSVVQQNGPVLTAAHVH